MKVWIVTAVWRLGYEDLNEQDWIDDKLTPPLVYASLDRARTAVEAERADNALGWLEDNAPLPDLEWETSDTGGIHTLCEVTGFSWQITPCEIIE